MSIYIPRAMISVIEQAAWNAEPNINPCICTKIQFHGYEISISSDSFLTQGDLFRTDIRVYKLNSDDSSDLERLLDVTNDFLLKDHSVIYGTGEELFRVMQAIQQKV